MKIKNLKIKFNKNDVRNFVPYTEVKDNLVITRDGNCFVMLQIFGLEFDLLDLQEQRQNIKLLGNFFNSLTNKITFLKSDLPFKLDQQLSFLNTLKQNQIQKQKQIINYKTETQNQMTAMEKSYFLAIHGNNQNLLLENVNNAMRVFSNSSIKIEYCDSELIKIVLKKLYDPYFKTNQSNLSLENENLSTFLSPKTITFHKNYIQMDDNYLSILTINQFLAEVEGGWLIDLLNSDLNFSIQIENVETLEARKLLNRNFANLKVNS
jgi:hypothetical protein